MTHRLQFMAFMALIAVPAFQTFAWGEASNTKVGEAQMISESVKKLLKFEGDLKGKGLSFELLDIYVASPNFRFLTPPDVIPFIHVGDGQQIGFLTEMGTKNDLEDADIVFVNPSGAEPIVLIARNIREFISILCTVKTARLFDGIDSYTKDADITKRFSEVVEDPEDRKTIAKILTKLEKAFEVKKAKSPVAYWKKIAKARKEKACVTTLDGLGIVLDPVNKKKVRRYDFSAKGAESPVKLEAFLKTASRPEKLAVLKDAIHYFSLSSGEHLKIMIMVKKELDALGLKSLASRLDKVQSSNNAYLRKNKKTGLPEEYAEE